MTREDISKLLCDLVKMLDLILETGDEFDNEGGGVRGLSKGRVTTRETCKLELLRFLLYIAAGCSVINEAQAVVLNLVHDDGIKMNAQKYQMLLRTLNIDGVSDTIPNLTLAAFRQADLAHSRQNGGTIPGFANGFVGTCESFGELMVSVSHNPISESRYHTAINQIRKLASQS